MKFIEARVEPLADGKTSVIVECEGGLVLRLGLEVLAGDSQLAQAFPPQQAPQPQQAPPQQQYQQQAPQQQQYTPQPAQVLQPPPGQSMQCPNCGAQMLYKQGKFGPFWGCVNYPNCRGYVKAGGGGGGPRRGGGRPQGRGYYRPPQENYG